MARLHRVTGLPAVTIPALASQLEKQPEVCVAFWQWKNLNRFADAGDFVGSVKVWNGGQNGMADRRAQMAGNDPIIARMENVSAIAAQVPDPKKPTVTKEDAAKGGGGAIVAGTIAAGTHQGWGAWEWSLALGGLVLVGVVAWLAWRYGWPAFKAWRERPAAYHDELLKADQSKAEKALPAPSAVWKSTVTTMPAPRKRAPRKPAAKPQGKRKPAKKSTKRKAA
jgi:hypothetical protein